MYCTYTVKGPNECHPKGIIAYFAMHACCLMPKCKREFKMQLIPKLAETVCMVLCCIHFMRQCNLYNT